MHTIVAFIVRDPSDVNQLLTRFQDDDSWGGWDWWSHGGRWVKELKEIDGCVETDDGYYVLPLEEAKKYGPPIVVTPFGHVFDNNQLTYEVSRGPAWDAVRDSIFDEYMLRSPKHPYVAVMVDVHS